MIVSELFWCIEFSRQQYLKQPNNEKTLDLFPKELEKSNNFMLFFTECQMKIYGQKSQKFNFFQKTLIYLRNYKGNQYFPKV